MWYSSSMTLSERCDNFIQEALPEQEVYRVGGSVRDELLLRRCRTTTT